MQGRDKWLTMAGREEGEQDRSPEAAGRGLAGALRA